MLFRSRTGPGGLGVQIRQDRRQVLRRRRAAEGASVPPKADGSACRRGAVEERGGGQDGAFLRWRDGFGRSRAQGPSSPGVRVPQEFLVDPFSRAPRRGRSSIRSSDIQRKLFAISQPRTTRSSSTSLSRSRSEVVNSPCPSVRTSSYPLASPLLTLMHGRERQGREWLPSPSRGSGPPR